MVQQNALKSSEHEPVRAGGFADDAVGAVTEEDEAVVAQYGWLKKVSDRVRGGEVCVFRSVLVDASVDAVVVL